MIIVILLYRFLILQSNVDNGKNEDIVIIYTRKE